MRGSELKRLPIAQVHIAEVSLADTGSVGEDRLEHGLQLAGRAADDLQHFRGCRLLLQRLAQLVQQACVLDGDNSLGSEIRHQLDLLVGERPNLLTEDTERANELLSLEHRHTNCCALAAELNGCDAIRVPFKIGAVAASIGNVDGLLRARDSTQKSV